MALYGSRAVSIPNVEVRQADLSNRDAVFDLVREIRPKTVFHTAAQTNVADCESHPEEARRAIVDATRNLVDAVKVHCPDGVFVHLSTDLVFDGRRGPGEPGYREEDAPNPLSVYAKLKWESEKPVLDLGGCVIRSALIYGPPATHRSSFLGWMVDTLRAGKELVLFEDEWRTPIHVQDLCLAMILLGHRRASGVWHAGGEDRLSRWQMGRLVCEALGLPTDRLRRATLSESTYGAPRPANVALDARRLWSTLGLRPRSFREGVISSLEG